MHEAIRLLLVKWYDIKIRLLLVKWYDNKMVESTPRGVNFYFAPQMQKSLPYKTKTRHMQHLLDGFQFKKYSL